MCRGKDTYMLQQHSPMFLRSTSPWQERAQRVSAPPEMKRGAGVGAISPRAAQRTRVVWYWQSTPFFVVAGYITAVIELLKIGPMRCTDQYSVHPQASVRRTWCFVRMHSGEPGAATPALILPCIIFSRYFRTCLRNLEFKLASDEQYIGSQ